MVTEQITTIGTIRDQIIEIDLEADGITIGQVIGVVITQITIDEVMQDQTTDKTPNGLLEIEVKVGIEMRIMNYNTRGRSRDRNNRRREELRSRSSSRVSTNCDRVRCY